MPHSYFDHTAWVFDGHRVPYVKAPAGIEIEYPPLAWWVTCLPRLFDGRQITDRQIYEEMRHSYHTTYRALMFLCDLCCFPLLLAIAWKRRRNLAGWAVLAYTLVTAALGHLLYDRIDVALLLLLLLWAFCWICSLSERGSRAGWSAAAYGFLGLSISFKLIPVVGSPFPLLADFHAPRRASRLAVGLLCLTVGACLPFFLQFLASGPAVLSVFTHHAERGIQIESLYASVILMASLFSTSISIVNTHGAFEVFCGWSPAMKTLSVILLPAFLIVTGLWALLRWSHYRREDAYCTTCFVIAAVVIFSNVFSPQYLIWAVPMMLLVALERLPRRERAAWVFFGALMLLIALTTWLFPFNYFRSSAPIPTGSPYGLVPDGTTFTSPSPVACVVLALRNMTYVGIVAWLGVMLVGRSDRQPADLPSGAANHPLESAARSEGARKQ